MCSHSQSQPLVQFRRRSVTFADEVEQDVQRVSQPLPSAHGVPECNTLQRHCLSHEHLCVGTPQKPARAMQRSKSFANSLQEAQALVSASKDLSLLPTSKCSYDLPEDPQESAPAAAFPFRNADASCFPEPFSESPRSSNRKQASARLARVLSWKMSKRSSSSSQGVGGLENESGMQAPLRRVSCSQLMMSLGPASTHSNSQHSSTSNSSSTENALVSQDAPMSAAAAPRRCQDAGGREDCSALQRDASSIQGFPPEATSKPLPSPQGNTSSLWCQSKDTAALANTPKCRQQTSGMSREHLKGTVALGSNLESRQQTLGRSGEQPWGAVAPGSRPESRQQASHPPGEQRPKGFAALRASVPLAKVLRPRSAIVP
ncbi:hypothetical protein DUNSADRAFT_316 [Dunaliella salina]|uniref:Uncharacterized protein n=1 Tax=Dunaliella salina TaxID=3046 RepID=A0ABQ7FZ53_DUNSA|nr:hypothetical protein DUNSADRAFT_316 [Dunaliella salina]|eukprot:KAF5827643.1 hypothetical protein DUNSADRAFT_316 [Dunaliella salina]